MTVWESGGQCANLYQLWCMSWKSSRSVNRSRPRKKKHGKIQIFFESFIFYKTQEEPKLIININKTLSVRRKSVIDCDSTVPIPGYIMNLRQCNWGRRKNSGAHYSSFRLHFLSSDRREPATVCCWEKVFVQKIWCTNCFVYTGALLQWLALLPLCHSSVFWTLGPPVFRWLDLKNHNHPTHAEAPCQSFPCMMLRY